VNYVRALNSKQAEAALRTISQLDNLIAQCEPLPLSLRNPQIIRKLLAAQANGALKIDVVIEQQAWEETPT
jgi:hypothetical protein